VQYSQLQQLATLRIALLAPISGTIGIIKPKFRISAQNQAKISHIGSKLGQTLHIGSKLKPNFAYRLVIKPNFAKESQKLCISAQN
jgi:hypothetical protein